MTEISTLVQVTSSTNNFQPTADSSYNTFNQMSRGEQWLGSLTASVTSASPSPLLPRRLPALPSQTRSQSLGSSPDNTVHAAPNVTVSNQFETGIHPLPTIPPRSPFHSTVATGASPINSHSVTNKANALPADPFDAEWAALATRSPKSTNPFLQNSVVKTFEVHM